MAIFATLWLALLVSAFGAVRCDVYLKGAVANHVSKFFEKDVSIFKQDYPSYNVSYDYMVSGPALALLSIDSVHFAITQNTAPNSSVCTTNGLLPMPLMAGVGGVFSNVPGLVDPKLDACTLAHIFAGSITKWSDPAIQKLNPDAKYAPGKIALLKNPFTSSLPSNRHVGALP
jgi:phosphate transport system substrate-binding protein